MFKNTNLLGYKVFPIFQSDALKRICCLKVDREDSKQFKVFGLKATLHLKSMKDSKKLC